MTDIEYRKLQPGDYIIYEWGDGEKTPLQVIEKGLTTRFKVLNSITFEQMLLCSHTRMTKATKIEVSLLKLQK